MNRHRIVITSLVAIYSTLLAFISLQLYISIAENGFGTAYMSVLYPKLTGSLAAYLIVRFVFWWTTRRNAVALTDAFYTAQDMIITLLLTLLTGENPLFDIERYRWLISLARTSIFYTTWIGIAVTSLMIYQQGTKRGNGGEDAT